MVLRLATYSAAASLLSPPCSSATAWIAADGRSSEGAATVWLVQHGEGARLVIRFEILDADRVRDADAG